MNNLSIILLIIGSLVAGACIFDCLGRIESTQISKEPRKLLQISPKIPESKAMILRSDALPANLRGLFELTYPNQILKITYAIADTTTPEDYNELVNIYNQIKKEIVEQNIGGVETKKYSMYEIYEWDHGKYRYTLPEIIQICDENILKKAKFEGWNSIT